MNQQQIRYVKSRAEEMYKGKQRQLNDKFRVKAVTLTHEQMHKALKSGDFKIKPYNTGAYYVRDFISFPQETPEAFDREGFEKALTSLQKSFNTLMDEIMIGDNEKAIKLLKEFEAI